jgi:hypothetical protein
MSVVRVPGCSVCKKPYTWSYDFNSNKDIPQKLLHRLDCKGFHDILVEVETK